MGSMRHAFTTPSRTIPIAIRRAVIERDGYFCRHCGRAVVCRSTREPWQPDQLHLDHLTPWAAGGEHTEDNLVVSCASCNIGRRPLRRQIVRTAAYLGIGCRDGAFYWLEGHRPTIVARGWDPDLLTLPEAASVLGATVRELALAINQGQLAATRKSPIRVELPADPQTWAADWRAGAL